MRVADRRVQPSISLSGSRFDRGISSFGSGGGFRGGAAHTPPEATWHDEVIDEVKRPLCWYELCEGAIYPNQGRKFEPIAWEVHSGIVRGKASSARYYTGCLDTLEVQVMQQSRV